LGIFPTTSSAPRTTTITATAATISFTTT
jgi:hypothetical protein